MSQNKTSTILVTGACGQIGSELTAALRRQYGSANVIACDIKVPTADQRDAGPFELVDVTQPESIHNVVKRHNVDIIYHLAAILSASGEEKPLFAWNVNMNGLYNILEVARLYRMTRVFCPSSIAVFGPETPKQSTPQETILRPKTMYGVTKVAGELLCEYYFDRFGLDVRGIRFPGVISSETLPGGGTTDYAVAIFYEAIKHKRYTCFVRNDTVLPMIYMPDCIRATLMLMGANLSDYRGRAGFNLAGLSFSAGELAAEIQKHMPEFVCDYKPDFRQQIADSWPRSIDDSVAQTQWGWKPEFDLKAMVEDMLKKLRRKYEEGKF